MLLSFVFEDFVGKKLDICVKLCSQLYLVIAENISNFSIWIIPSNKPDWTIKENNTPYTGTGGKVADGEDLNKRSSKITKYRIIHYFIFIFCRNTFHFNTAY